MTDWVRLWHDMPTDPKWRVIARKSGQPLPCVIAVFNLMMVNASANSGARGTLSCWDDEDAGAALDISGEDVSAIRVAMQGKVLDGDRLSGWEKRQPKREDGNAAERKAAWKERKSTPRNAMERNGTLGNAPETETETETDIPLPDGNGAADPEKVMFDSGISLLALASIPEARARPMLGRWRRDHGAGNVISALGKAKREGAIDPVSFIEACLKANQKSAAYDRDRITV